RRLADFDLQKQVVEEIAEFMAKLPSQFSGKSHVGQVAIFAFLHDDSCVRGHPDESITFCMGVIRIGNACCSHTFAQNSAHSMPMLTAGAFNISSRGETDTLVEYSLRTHSHPYPYPRDEYSGAEPADHRSEFVSAHMAPCVRVAPCGR